MRNTCRASRNREHSRIVHGLLLLCVFCVFRFIDSGNELIDALRRLERCRKVFVEKQHGKFAQHIDVHIVFCVRSGNKEHHVHFLAVWCVELHSVRHNHRRQSCALHRVALAVRNCHALSDCGCAFLFACKNAFAIGVNVCDFAALRHQINDFVDSVRFVRSRCIKTNAFFAQ